MTIQSTTLTNFEIKELLDKYSNQYFVIVNKDNSDEAYFCFQRKVKTGWEILTSNPGELELEYEERADNLTGKIYKQVISAMKPKETFTL